MCEALIFLAAPYEPHYGHAHGGGRTRCIWRCQWQTRAGLRDGDGGDVGIVRGASSVHACAGIEGTEKVSHDLLLDSSMHALVSNKVANKGDDGFTALTGR